MRGPTCDDPPGTSALVALVEEGFLNVQRHFRLKCFFKIRRDCYSARVALDGGYCCVDYEIEISLDYIESEVALAHGRGASSER